MTKKENYAKTQIITQHCKASIFREPFSFNLHMKIKKEKQKVKPHNLGFLYKTIS